MANIPVNPTYNNVMAEVETTTPASADFMNTTLGQLLNNDEANKQAIDEAKSDFTNVPARSELTSVITNVVPAADGVSCTLVLTVYDATAKTASSVTKIVAFASETEGGPITKETYSEILSLRDDVAALQNQGGKFIGTSAATKADLENYTVPSGTNVGDFTYVLDDEGHNDATTRWIYDGVTGSSSATHTTNGFAFAYVINYDPVGIANTTTLGLVKSAVDDQANGGQIYVEADGTPSVIGWNTLVSRMSSAESGLAGKAPIYHSATDNTYGFGSGAVYGHVKLRDIVDASNNVNSGIATTPIAVYNYAADKSLSQVANADFLAKAQAAGVGGGIPYGVCTTYGGTAEKVVTVSGISTLTEGTMLLLLLANANIVPNPTLSVNGTAAISIMSTEIYTPGSSEGNVLSGADLPAGKYLLTYQRRSLSAYCWAVVAMPPQRPLWVKLKDVTLTATAQNYDLDLSNLGGLTGEYSRISLHITTPEDLGAGASGNMFGVRINGITEYYRYANSASADAQNSIAFFFVGPNTFGINNAIFNVASIDIALFRNGTTNTVYSIGDQPGGSPMSTYVPGRIARFTGAAGITTINIVDVATAYRFLPIGTRIVLYGLRT